uniref:Uncharacterized protein n=1 Tax=Pithovirus LCPAC101 TaxID=2506586 RepID=A0A481Z475_9VIRU|nr:MAG: hypothetical protein LCPAC101_01310 [Pithovirus LCPAC101]
MEHFSNLTVNTSILKDMIHPSTEQTLYIKNKLVNFYKHYDVYNIYGDKQINYVCELATNYALWTLPVDLRNDNTVVEAYGYWLSIIWIIDSSFDTAGSKNLRTEKDILVNIIEKAINDEPVNLDNFVVDKNKSRHDQLMSSLPKVLYMTFTKYILLISTYKTMNNYAFDMTNKWLFKYFDNLVGDNDDKNIQYSKIECDLDDYYEWRLADSAMMCVCWHLVLFMNIPCEKLTDSHTKLFEISSILVAYHNDILSYHRDISQDTKNLVRCIMYNCSTPMYREKGNESIKAGVITSIKYIDGIYGKLSNLYKELIDQYPSNAKFMHDICISVVKGSHNWANNEKRYEKGIRMIKSIEDNNDFDFYGLFDNLNVVSGDPTL